MAEDVIREYGFRFGAQLVERCMELPDGHTVVSVTTDAGRKLDIYAWVELWPATGPEGDLAYVATREESGSIWGAPIKLIEESVRP